MYMGCSGATSICTQVVVVQGAYISKNWFFSKIFSMMVWEKFVGKRAKCQVSTCGEN
jgi:hypothetical protein